MVLVVTVLDNLGGTKLCKRVNQAGYHSYSQQPSNSSYFLGPGGFRNCLCVGCSYSFLRKNRDAHELAQTSVEITKRPSHALSLMTPQKVNHSNRKNQLRTME
eukprot:scaffold163776_cov67-Attheya_sp.AAC.1